LVGDKDQQPSDVFGLTPCLPDNRQNIRQRLGELVGEVVANYSGIAIPSDLPGDKQNRAAFKQDPVAVASRLTEGFRIDYGHIHNFPVLGITGVLARCIPLAASAYLLWIAAVPTQDPAHSNPQSNSRLSCE